MWMMSDDVLRVSTMAEPTTSRGTQQASWNEGGQKITDASNQESHVQMGNLEGT